MKFKIDNILRVFTLLICFFCFTTAIYSQAIQSPTQFIGSDYGKQFTPHHQLVDYFQHLAENSSKIKLQKYGETNEGRPLYLAIISSKENMESIEDIRKTNLQNAQLVSQKPTTINEKSIVWLSYSVHGNEAGGSESSMNVAYQLLKDNKLDKWLKDVVVIIDPSLNPDGYSRYSHWVKGNAGKMTHPNLTDVEHMEPWPGGRVNHYLFDLNRDWAWQTQVETKKRIKQYNKWMPHVHADLHEMGFDNHYYFAPAAEPFHKSITDWQRELQFDIGKNHAKYFDKEGWLYFTREIFDLLYPSYGDTWPTFNGSIGMTYEQAGHGMSGRSIKMSNGKNLLLQDRIDHHTTTSLSTIETAAVQKEKIISNFKDYFNESVKNPVGTYKHFIVKQGELLKEFKSLLSKNGIQYETIGAKADLSGHSYLDNQNTKFKVEQGDLYISSFQAKSTLLQVLMEEEPVLADSITYDITSWCAPFAYNLECYGLKSVPKLSFQSPEFQDVMLFNNAGSYGVALKWNNGFASKVALGKLLSEGVIVKAVQKSIELEDGKLERGDLVMLRGDQLDVDKFNKTITSIINTMDLDHVTIKSGFSISGSDLGGSGLSKIEKPKVLTFFGNGVHANAYGQVWNYFENILKYPISRVDINKFNRVELSDFNTIILPDGYYSLSEKQTDAMSDWVSNGGKLISIAGANRILKKSEKFAIGKDNKEEDEDIEKSRKEQEKRDRVRKYEGAERRSIAGSIPGAIFKTEIDNTHPLCYGVNSYYTLKNSSASYPFLGEGAFNPIRIPKNYQSYGFIGSNIERNFDDNFVFSVESKGSGKVIYMADNPLFRAFWKSGEVIFANALFQVI